MWCLCLSGEDGWVPFLEPGFHIDMDTWYMDMYAKALCPTRPDAVMPRTTVSFTHRTSIVSVLRSSLA